MSPPDPSELQPARETGVCCTALRELLEHLWRGIAGQIREDLVPRLTGQLEGVRLRRTALDRRLERYHLDAQHRWLRMRSVLDIDDVFGIQPLEGIEFPELRHRALPVV